MTDIVEMGPGEAEGPHGEISYAVGPSQVRRIVDLVVVPAALGVAALVVAMASLMVIDPASEIGETDIFTNASNANGSLLELRWASGLRALAALVAVALAISAARILIGRRARVRVGAAAPEADDPSSLDAMEAAAIASLNDASTGEKTIVGAAIAVSLLALAFNASAFGFAMASHLPQATGNPLGF